MISCGAAPAGGTTMLMFEPVVKVLLVILVVLLVRATEWIKLIGESLGCNRYRTKSIAEMTKKLAYAETSGEFMTREESKALDEELKNVFAAELRGGPARAWQLMELNEHMKTLIRLLEAQTK
jgi:hypothetical protein